MTEVLNPRDVERGEYSDMLQIGARNMQNFTLLREVGMSRRPVLLKRGLSATISEWLQAADYIISGGNHNVVLCERGIRTFETETRNTFDLSAVAAVHELSHLPIVADPSHGTGKWRYVTPMARAAVAAGADGLLIEVHPNPNRRCPTAPSPFVRKCSPSSCRRCAGSPKRWGEAYDTHGDRDKEGLNMRSSVWGLSAVRWAWPGEPP